MTAGSFLLKVYIAFAFVSWVIVGKSLHVGSAWVGTMVMVSTLIAVFGYSFGGLRGPVPGLKALIVLFILGLANGFAVCFYSARTEASINAGPFVITVSVLMAVAALIIDLVFNKAVPTRDQLIGTLLAIGAIYFLSPKN